MKKIISLIAVLSLSATIAGCSATVKSSQGANPLDNNYTYQYNSSLDLKVAYESLNNMVNDSQIIVEGKVLNTDPVALSNSIVTKFNFKITDSLKGDNLIGKTLEFASAGGIVSVADYLKTFPIVKKDFESNVLEKLTDEEKKSQKVKYTMGDFPLIESGKDYIIFAKKDKLASGEEVYVPLGIAQGVFEIDNNKIIKPFSKLGQIKEIKDSEKDFKDKIIKIKNQVK